MTTTIALAGNPNSGKTTLFNNLTGARQHVGNYPGINVEKKEGYYADVVIFDPETVNDKATFDEPLQFAVGVEQVFVNGIQVLENGEHTGAFPGRFIKGAGYNEQ